MVDSVSAVKPLTVDKPFTTLNYTTKDGEHVSATKNNGIVTLVGDQNGTRQMPVDEFLKDFLNSVPVVNNAPAPAQAPVETPKAPTAPEVGKKLDVAA